MSAVAAAAAALAAWSGGFAAAASRPNAPETVIAHPWGEHEIAISWTGPAPDGEIAGYELLRGGRVVARTADTHASERGLDPSTRYCYEVRAHDAAGNVSPSSLPACATTHDLTPPTAPAAEALPVSDRKMLIRWAESSDNVAVARYEVERDGRAIQTTRPLEAFDRGLEPDRPYCYTVRAFDRAGNASEARACARTPDVTPPTAPGRLALSALSAAEVFVAWEPSQDDARIAAYEIVLGDEVVETVGGPPAVVPGLSPEREHCLAVRAVDGAGNRSDAAGPVCVTTPDRATPAAPFDLRVEVGTSGAQLRWEPSTEPDVTYAVYRDDGRRMGLTRAESYSLEASLAHGRCFRVAAVDGAGRESPRTVPACAAAGVSAGR